VFQKLGIQQFAIAQDIIPMRAQTSQPFVHHGRFLSSGVFGFCWYEAATAAREQLAEPEQIFKRAFLWQGHRLSPTIVSKLFKNFPDVEPTSLISMLSDEFFPPQAWPLAGLFRWRAIRGGR
jgi:hypothetical protein